jgi:hypothetical protein
LAKAKLPQARRPMVRATEDDSLKTSAGQRT